MLGRQDQRFVVATLRHEIARQIPLMEPLLHQALADRLGVVTASRHGLGPRLDHLATVHLRANFRWLLRIVIGQVIATLTHRLAGHGGGNPVTLTIVRKSLGTQLPTSEAKDMTPARSVPGTINHILALVRIAEGQVLTVRAEDPLA